MRKTEEILLELTFLSTLLDFTDVTWFFLLFSQTGGGKDSATVPYTDWIGLVFWVSHQVLIRD